MKIRTSSIKALGFFVIILTLTFGSIAWYTLGELEKRYNTEVDFVITSEFDLLRNNLAQYLGKAKIMGENYASEISRLILEEFGGDLERVADSLDDYHVENNKIRGIVTHTLTDSYFEGIASDAMDPFIVRGNQVELDSSENCASYGNSRTFEQEYTMHANPILAEIAFNRIDQADLENMNAAAIDRPIFFQFIDHPQGEEIQVKESTPEDQSGKRAIILDSYDIDGLEAYFRETLSWENTFYSFEFITPTYLFNTEDLAGRRYVEGGIRTEIPRLSINIVFNYKTLIDNNPLLKRDLIKYQMRLDTLHNLFLRDERSIYLLVILMILICTMGVKYTNKLASEGIENVIQSRRVKRLD